jgi:5'-nucleotidase
MGLRHTRGRSGLAAFVRPRFAALALVAGALGTSLAAPGCSSDSGTSSACPPGQTCQVRLTILHTSDIHSRIYPYDLQILQVDSDLGLGTLNAVKNIGGIARVSYVVNRERARADRVLHLDSGDIFEGAPIFNFFNGEPEVRASSMLGVDAMVIGNHEFDHGAVNVARQMQRWASFPVLAANYTFDPALAPNSTDINTILRPFTTFNLEGLKVGVIGMANFSSLSSIFDQPNGLDVYPLNTVETAQAYVDLLRPMVDVVVVLSHLGLDVDERMVRNTTGIDVVMGGHNHIVINPPQALQDCSSDPNQPGFIWRVDSDLTVDPSVPPPNDDLHPDPVNHPYQMHRKCTPRSVLISHSGAFAKYVGRLDLVLSNDPATATPAAGHPEAYEPVNGFEVVSSTYLPFPIDDSVPEDPAIVDLLQPYARVLDRVADLNTLVGFSPNGAKRIAPQGGDSPLGNLVADAMWLRLGVQTDFSMTNSTGIRTDLIPGPITIEQMYNIFPFDNSITKMELSGLEVQELFDFIARRSLGRGCQSQAQIAGARVVLDCAGCNGQYRGNANGACAQDADCIGGEPGTCQSGQCVVTACAEQIYIGYGTTPCNTDDDCPDKLPTQCDRNAHKCSSPIQLENLYELATNNYIAAGGSGFRVLQRNTTQLDTKIQQRDALIDYIRNGKPCGWSPTAGTPDGLQACATDADCASVGDFVCACAGQVSEQTAGGMVTCATSGPCADGRCVRRDCRDQVATFHDKACAGAQDIDQCRTSLDACSLAGEECKILSCVDDTLGAVSDNRQEMVGR